VYHDGGLSKKIECLKLERAHVNRLLILRQKRQNQSDNGSGSHRCRYWAASEGLAAAAAADGGTLCVYRAVV
jgi:hypothetical protein